MPGVALGRWQFAATAWLVLLGASGWARGPVDFDTEVVPVLTRQGCNAGACHGAAIGRGGFKLSLFGSDAAADHKQIARALEGRRVHLVDPQRSLLLRKATETVEHGGGVRLEDGSEAYELLRQWVAEGARRRQSRRLTSVEVRPAESLLEQVGESVQVTVTATFDDGQREDVTRWSVLTANDPAAVDIDTESARLTVRRRGEHVVVVRYLDQVQAIRIAVPLGEFADGLPRPAAGVNSAEGLIDRHVDAQLRRLRIPASPPADDHAFARRVWLDLTGQLPSPEAVQAFAADTDPDKRPRLIDRLLASDEFADLWALKWANILAIDSARLEPAGADAYHRWIAERFRQDAPWDEAAAEMLTATGDSYEVGPANFSRTGGGAEGLTEYATRVFMGVRLRCANCHNHPLDHWQQDDYHGLAAIFAKVRPGRVVAIAERGEVTHPVTGEPARPRIPGVRFLVPGADGRQAFARWLTADDNPYLARATVNRVWRQLMGRGLIEPVDDLRDTNPATHPELLEALAEQFVESGFRFRPLIREICRSQAYQRTARTLPGNAADTTYYSHFMPRPLEAEVVADAIATVTGVPLTLGEDLTVGGRAGRRAVETTDNRLTSVGLDVLGRCDRSMECEATSSGGESLGQALHFLNGDLLNQPIGSPACVLTELLDQQTSDLDVVEQLYWRAFGRPLRAAEREHWSGELAASDLSTPARRRAFFEDVLWSLLTSEAFLTNR